jgi:protein SCO1
VRGGQRCYLDRLSCSRRLLGCINDVPQETVTITNKGKTVFFSGIILTLSGLLFAPRAARAQAPIATEQTDTGITYSAQKPGVLPPILQGVGITQHLGAQIPLDAVFKDETGKDVTLGSYFGKKPVVLILAYYKCPMLCSLVLSGATNAFKASGFQLGNQFEALTVSFSPDETPEMAAAAQKQYLHQYGAEASDWHFLTGQEPQIQRLTNVVGFEYKYNPANGQYAHAAGLVVLTPAGKVSKYFYGVHFEPRDLRLALVDSSNDHIGSLADEVLLFCCTYDPGTGKYHAAITRIIDLACGFTVLVMGLGIFFLYRSARGKGNGDPQPA